MQPAPAVDPKLSPIPSGMSRLELKAGASLASLFGLRMLGLFLILPVFAVHAPQLAGGDNLTLVGIALGAYGLSQAILQIPFGMASDRFGRKPVIAVGLVVFALGSFLAAMATDIHVAIAGRALQGAGAISSVVVAFAADLTREEHRTKTMAMIGATIGFVFALSMVVAPVLYDWVGMGGLFVLTGVLALAGLIVVFGVIPDAPRIERKAQGPAPTLMGIILDPELARLNFGIFALHLVQMAMFVVLPAALVDAGLPLSAHWKAYLPAVLVSFALMVPPIMYADRRNRPQVVMAGAVGLMLIVQGGLVLAQGLGALVAMLLLFFVSFNVLEAMLPSLISRIAPESARGSAIGVYNTTQTMGLFAGGLAGGWMAKHFGAVSVFGLGAALMLVWLVLVAGMRPVNPTKSRSLTVETNRA
jgi:MFS family permease